MRILKTISNQTAKYSRWLCVCVCELCLFDFFARRRFSYFEALDFEVIAHFSDLKYKRGVIVINIVNTI